MYANEMKLPLDITLQHTDYLRAVERHTAGVAPFPQKTAVGYILQSSSLPVE